jgi:hypothetical protein
MLQKMVKQDQKLGEKIAKLKTQNLENPKTQMHLTQSEASKAKLEEDLEVMKDLINQMTRVLACYEIPRFKRTKIENYYYNVKRFLIVEQKNFKAVTFYFLLIDRWHVA